MAISSSYINADTIVLDGDYLHTLAPGMAIRADCGVDGIKIVKIKWVEYKGGKTIIYAIPTESADLTANLSSVDFSCVKPTNQKHIGNFGNIPVDWIWAYRGFRRGLYLLWNGWDSITIKPGMIHYVNYYTNRECLLTLESEITWAGFTSAGYSASTWYYIYLNHIDEDDNVINPATSSFEISSTAPSFDSAKFKWYHPTTYKNCIWFFESAGTSGVHPFIWHPNIYTNCRYNYERQEYRWTGSYVQNIGADLPLTIPSSFKIMQQWFQVFFWDYYVECYGYAKVYNCPSSPNAWIWRHTHPSSYGSTSSDQAQVILPMDNNKVYTAYFNTDINSSYQGYLKSESIYFYLPIGFIET